jgi:hypothetical protein
VLHEGIVVSYVFCCSPEQQGSILILQFGH